MKRLAFFLLLLTAAWTCGAQRLTVGTYNIRLKADVDYKRGDGWDTRKQALINLLNFVEPDIFGTQEGFDTQLDDIKKGLRTYDYIGAGRDDGKKKGEHSAIFYNKQRLVCVEQGNFWLSETPDKPGKGWDAAYPRICSWGKFKLKGNGKTFYFFNLHADHIGKTAQREAAKLVLNRIREIAGNNAPVVLTGDFNVPQGSEPYNIVTQSGLLADAYTLAKTRLAPNGTYQDFNPEAYGNERIDHVFLSNQWAVSRYGMLTNLYWHADEQGNYTPHLPSDHYPVMVKVRLK